MNEKLSKTAVGNSIEFLVQTTKQTEKGVCLQRCRINSSRLQKLVLEEKNKGQLAIPYSSEDTEPLKQLLSCVA